MSDNIVTPINEATDKPANPFDPASIRLSQDFTANVGVKQAILDLPVRKPNRQWFIRTHPSSDMRVDTALVELKDTGEIYLVAAPMRHELPGEVTARVLIPTINRQGNLFFWHIGLPDENGKHNSWHRSALAAADLAANQWVKVTANRSGGSYDTFVATGDLPEPDWPDLSLAEMLKLAFQDRHIDSPDHPVVKMLRGAS